MKIQKPDLRTREEVIAAIGQLAKAYTPEWKFDLAHPDAGTALALIFADMFFGTIKRYNRIPEKLKIDFFRHMGLKMLPAVPAEGYVTFGLSSHEFGGTQIPKGTVVMASGKTAESQKAVYETAEALYVAPAEISQLLFIDGQEDHIEKKDWKKPFMPFCKEGENLQEHVLYLCQNDVFSVTGQAEIRMKLQMYGPDGEDADLSWMTRKEEISIAYGTGDTFEEFADRRWESGYLVLQQQKEQPEAGETELFGKRGYWLRCSYQRAWKQEPFVVQDIRLAARKNDIEPDYIGNETGEQQNRMMYPFGEYPALFRECYISSREAMGKAGAKIRITFCLDYEKIPMDNSIQPERKWKILMKRSDFKPDPEYDITIEQVAWEYYNGSGWSRLLLAEKYQELFNGKNGSVGEQELEFICPKDAALLEWQGAPTRYIRIRVLRMNNLYQWKGSYITPVIRNIRFHYSYTGEGMHPEMVAASNNCRQIMFPVEELRRGPVRWEIFFGQREKAPGMYLGFDHPLQNGPIRIYLSLTCQSFGIPQRDRERSRLVFEYSGKRGFSPLEVLDGTGGFRKSGCLTFLGKEDFAPGTVCGEKAYWLRITNKREVDGKRDFLQDNPGIEGIFLNTVKVLAVESRLPESFSIKAEEKNKVCQLLGNPVYDLAVWVNELSVITRSQHRELKREGRVEEVRDAAGKLTGVWVRWEEAEDFEQSKENDRHYLLDRNQGIVTFSDGKKGAIPPSGEKETIRIVYRCGGGERGNQPPGSVNRLGSSHGYVNHLTNHQMICGGYDQETAAQAIRRKAQTMRHRGRAVTASDYEALACEASRFIWKVKCYPGYDGQGKYEPGSVTIVILQKEFENERRFFWKLKEDISEYLLCRMGGNLAAQSRLYVTEPQFLELDCYVKIITDDYDHVFEVQKSVEEQLKRFIHPVTGNYHGKGWEIGTVPNETQIANALKGVPNVRFIWELRIMAYIRTGRRRMEIQLDGREQKRDPSCPAARFAVAINGNNVVECMVLEEETCFHK